MTPMRDAKKDDPERRFRWRLGCLRHMPLRPSFHPHYSSSFGLTEASIVGVLTYLSGAPGGVKGQLRYVR
jgi:hypothetical protein